MSSGSFSPLSSRAQMGLLILIVLISTGGVYFHWWTSPLELPYSRSSDLLRHYLPFKQYLHQSLAQSGSLVGWNPLSQGGRPQLADPGVGAFYPLAVPFFFGPPEHLFTLFFLAHIALGMALAYRLMRTHGLGLEASTLGALSYGLNLKLIATQYAGFATMVPAQALLPGAFLCLEAARQQPISSAYRYGIGLGIVLALQILAGDAQLMLYSLPFLAAYGALVPPQSEGKSGSRARAMGTLAAVLGGALLLALLLSSPLLLRAQLLTRASPRAEGVPFGIASLMSVPPAQLPAFLFPALSGSEPSLTWQLEGPFWELAFYPGLVTWLLTLAALVAYRIDARLLPLLVLVYLAFFFAMGHYAPIFPLFYYLVPGFDLFRGPSRVLPIAALFLALIAALVLERLPVLQERARGRLRVLLGTAFIAGLLALGYGLLNRPALEGRFQRGLKTLAPNELAGVEGASAWLIGLTVALVLIVGFALVTGLLSRRGKPASPHAPILLVLMLGLELAFQDAGILQTAPLEAVAPPHPVVAALRSGSSPSVTPEPPVGRVLDLAGVLPELVTIEAGIRTFNGMNPLVLTRPYLLGRYLAGEPPEIPMDRSVYGILVQELHHERLLPLLRVTDILQNSDAPIPGYEVTESFSSVQAFQQFLGVATWEKVYRLRCTTPLPAAILVQRVALAPAEPREILARLEEMDLLSAALLEDPTQPLEALPGPLSALSSDVLAVSSSSPEGAVAVIGGATPDEERYRVLSPPGGAVLVTTELEAPGWTVTVSGREAKGWRADFLLRAVYVPEGEQTVVWRYRN